MANRNWSNGGKIYAMHTSPVLVDCNFIVDPANGNGLGIRSLKGPGVKAVYMHTSSTPAAGSPDPAAGYIYVQLQDNYNRSLSGFNAVVSPLSGTPLAVTLSAAALTIGNPYVIVSLGTTTAADWTALGVPAGLTPSVGMSFIAQATGHGTGSGMVEAPSLSNIENIETIGDPNQSIANASQQTNGGAIFILQCTKNGALATPATGTVISLAFYLSNSSVSVQGE